MFRTPAASVYCALERNLSHYFSGLSCEMSTRREHPHEECLFNAMKVSEEIALRKCVLIVLVGMCWWGCDFSGL